MIAALSNPTPAPALQASIHSREAPHQQPGTLLAEFPEIPPSAVGPSPQLRGPRVPRRSRTTGTGRSPRRGGGGCGGRTLQDSQADSDAGSSAESQGAERGELDFEPMKLITIERNDNNEQGNCDRGRPPE